MSVRSTTNKKSENTQIIAATPAGLATLDRRGTPPTLNGEGSPEFMVQSKLGSSGLKPNSLFLASNPSPIQHHSKLLSLNKSAEEYTQD